METHGGAGRLYLRCYSGLRPGVVFESDEAKTGFLVKQRPAWAVYQCKAERAIASGVGFHVKPSFFDLDPYGQPWPCIDAILKNELPDRIAFAVHDGLRMGVCVGRGWSVESLGEAVQQFGNDGLFKRYLEICRWMMQRKLRAIGFELQNFSGYYCGAGKRMTHWAAIAQRVPVESSFPDTAPI